MKKAKDDETPRQPLTRKRIVQAAVDLADREGIDALTMRRLGAALRVEAMALYKHVANKEDILDGVVDHVIAEIEIPGGQLDWQEAMRRRALSARAVLVRHSWAIGLLESRSSMGPNVVRYIDAILGSLRGAGFSIEGAAHALWMLDSFVYGHVIQEVSLPFGTSAEMAEASPSPDPTMAAEFPHLAEVVEHALVTDYNVDAEFDHGLELILGALARRLTDPQTQAKEEIGFSQPARACRRRLR